ncbi:hypothetical protein K8R32_02795 [bacterium]|nr:hypothetical protein [bacterium]
MDKFFQILRVTTGNTFSLIGDEKKKSSATVWIQVNGKVEITADEGVGTVNAIFLATKKIIKPYFSLIDKIDLFDFSVRSINSDKIGTEAEVETGIILKCNGYKLSFQGQSDNLDKAWTIALNQGLNDCLEVLMKEKQ